MAARLISGSQVDAAACETPVAASAGHSKHGREVPLHLSAASWPQHALTCRPSHMIPHGTGSAAMRTRLLEARGWQVVAVPFFEWNQACERDRQLDYLWSKLPPHLATRGGLWGSG